MGRKGYLGEFEQLVLLAALRLEGDAYGPSIAGELESRAGRRVSRGALYATLDRLEGKGFLTWSVDGASPERSGHGEPKSGIMLTVTISSRNCS